MQSQVIEQQQVIEQEEAPVCRHRWLIESPHGATSMGRCRLCGEVKAFRNSASDTLWEGDPMNSISKMGGGASRPVVRELAPSLKEE